MTRVKRTSGGAWDPTSPNLVFLAGAIADIDAAANPYTLVAVNEIENAKHVDTLRRWFDQGRHVFLDSGIFNLAMSHAKAHGLTHDQALNLAPEEVDGFEALYDRYLALATQFKANLWGVIELDQGGREHKPRTRARITKDSGIVPIPVYHPFGDGWDYYDGIAASHDRICFGNLVKAPAPTRLRLMWTAAERARQHPHLWTHLLGVTPSAAMLSMPMRGSCDSSAWLSAVRWSSSWRGWSMLHRHANYPPAMTYDRGSSNHGAEGENGYRKAKSLLAATALFQQRTVVAVTEDTHTTTHQGAGTC